MYSAYCGGKSYEWGSQQMFMIDIDNGLTINEAINNIQINIVPNFIYTSFTYRRSSCSGLVFIVDKETSQDALANFNCH